MFSRLFCFGADICHEKRGTDAKIDSVICSPANHRIYFEY